MNLHEYQAKTLLQKYQLPIPLFGVAESIQQVKLFLEQENLNQAVIKVQVHAGGRGKAGGVKIAKTKQEILSFSEKLLGMKVVNAQTGPSGLISQKILITPLIPIEREYYLSFLIDRTLGKPVILASKEGGVNIEEAGHQLLKMAIPLKGELKSFHLENIIRFFDWRDELGKQGKEILKKLARAFYELDATLLEINPLVLSKGNLEIVDAKLVIDDDALFRHPGFDEFYDPTQFSEQEALAKKEGLAYVALEGNIGCIVNGAGLAMATMDLIQTLGGKPANFLDVGGGATKDKVAYGFKVILRDPNVKAIFVNIFGGIMDCALMATGIVEASKEESINVPLIVRLEGNNVEKGREILDGSGLKILAASSMLEGAQLAIKAINR